MATVNINEYADIASTFGKQAQCPAEPVIATQNVTTSGTTAQSAAFNANTRMIGISTPAAQAVAYLVGDNPTALVTSFRLPSSQVFYLGVKPGQKIAFIDVT